jgi:hypothetical protein
MVCGCRIPEAVHRCTAIFSLEGQLGQKRLTRNVLSVKRIEQGLRGSLISNRILTRKAYSRLSKLILMCPIHCVDLTLVEYALPT